MFPVSSQASLALIYGSDARSNPVADRLLEAHDETLNLVHALEACASGRGIMGGLMWRPSHVLKMLQALSYKQTHSRRLVESGAVPVIVRVMLNEKSSHGRQSLISHDGGKSQADGHLTEIRHDPLFTENTSQALGGGDKGSLTLGPTMTEPPSPPRRPSSFDPPDSPVTMGWKLVDVDLALYSCRTLTNLASWSSLRKTLVAQGVIKVMNLFKEHHDLRVADSAQTCLLLVDDTEENEVAKNALLTQMEDDPQGEEGQEQE
jgi:hypothetical protein